MHSIKKERISASQNILSISSLSQLIFNRGHAHRLNPFLDLLEQFFDIVVIRHLQVAEIITIMIVDLSL